MKVSKKIPWIAGATALALIVLVGASLRDAPAEAPPSDAPAVAAKPALTVTVVTPQREEWAQTLPANGTIAAWHEAVIGAEVAGLRLTEVLANVGDRVRKGQVLARLQSDTVEAEVAQSRAALHEAEATLAEAHANAERARQLHPRGAISAQQLQQNLTAENTARARVESLQARLKADLLRLAQTQVRSPDDGVISARGATIGAVAQPGQDLFRLIRQERLEWRAEVAGDQLVLLRAGMPATLTLATGASVIGTIRTVAPTVDPATRNGLVYVDLPAPGAARSGMFARGAFALGKRPVLSLPQSAVLLRDGFAYVFTVGDDGKVARAKVALGLRQGERVEIAEGLAADARVVASGAAFLGDGDTVRVVEAPAPGAPR